MQRPTMLLAVASLVACTTATYCGKKNTSYTNCGIKNTLTRSP